MITVVCCYNNKKMYDDFVVKSLCSQENHYELIGIDNTDGKFKSMASAYNAVLNDIHSDYVLFCHQDIDFLSHDSLKLIYEYLVDHPFELVGFAGITKNCVVFSNLKYRDDDSYITNAQLDQSKYVEALDECCFACKKDVLLDIGGFNEKLCNGWHLYCAELCLRWKLRGFLVSVLPVSLYHKDNGSSGLYVDGSFLAIFKKIALHYRKFFSKIYSCCYVSSTNPILLCMRLFKTSCGLFIRSR